MEKSSQKNSIIKSLVKGALALTFIFAINSIAYVTYQKKVDAMLEQKEAAQALFYSTEIDQISLGGNISNTVSKCKKPSDVSCEILLENLLGLRNRFYDYSILLWNTLGYPKDSQPVSKLLEREKAVGDFINKYFGISLNEAKKQNAFTPQAYLELVQEKTAILPTARIGQSDLTKFQGFIEESYQEFEIIFGQVAIDDEEIKDAIDQQRLLFILLIIAEILLFSLVNIADLIINSSFNNKSNSSPTV